MWTRALPVLSALTPDRALGDVIAEAGVDADDVLPTVRRLYELGFLMRN